MGKWNRRYIPRKNFKRYDCENPPSPPRFDIPHSYLSANNKVPLWEIEYCHSVRVPWRKVLASKKYIYCYPNVLDWDGSAGKEALEIAKQRYWAMSNGLPCDHPLPNPDIYIDEIDWNSYVDPELMADLELHVFNSDDMLKVDRLETINEEGGSAETQDDKNQLVCGNPWEGNHVQGTRKLKDDVQGWSGWDDPINPQNDNPWEQYCSQLVDPLDNNAWRSGSGSWGWPQGVDNTSVRQEGWGQRDNNSWSWDVQGSSNLGGCGYSSGSKHLTGSKERDWGDHRGESWGWKGNSRIDSGGWRKSEYNCSDSNYRDSQRFNGGRSSRGGYRKRESSLQHTSKYKSSRFHSDTYGNSRPL